MITASSAENVVGADIVTLTKPVEVVQVTAPTRPIGAAKHMSARVPLVGQEGTVGRVT